MSKYDPFERGSDPVGVRTLTWRDESRDRTLPVEVWYPAEQDLAGQDLDEATCDHYKPSPFAPKITQAAIRDAAPRASTGLPLIVFSHGFGGERRQSTHLCTHWASHGYAVIAVDHVGNTTMDMVQQSMGRNAPDPEVQLAEFIADRPTDASFAIDRALAGDLGLEIDETRIGMSGHSFGGWTTLASTGRDERIRAALPLAPAGGRSEGGLAGPAEGMAAALELGWEREVPTLYLVAEFDTLLPLDGMRDLLARTPKPSRGVTLLNADHFHFCDRVEEAHELFRTMGPMIAGAGPGGPDMSEVFGAMKSSAQLCPGSHAYAFLQGLGLAHMDAVLGDDPRAQELIKGDLVALLAARGIASAAL
jgi:dienelactone hydrolase